MTTCINKGDHLFVEVNGPYSLGLLLETIHDVADHCQRENLDKVLIDLRNIKGHLTIFDRFQLGTAIAKSWGPRLKVAVIAKHDFINRMTENTAVNRGVKIIATPSPAEANRWLGLEPLNQTVNGE